MCSNFSGLQIGVSNASRIIHQDTVLLTAETHPITKGVLKGQAQSLDLANLQRR